MDQRDAVRPRRKRVERGKRSKDGEQSILSVMETSTLFLEILT